MKEKESVACNELHLHVRKLHAYSVRFIIATVSTPVCAYTDITKRYR